MTELAADGVPVTVTCRVFKLCRQDYYRWRHQLVSGELLDEAYLTSAIFDAHADDPKFRYRFLADEVHTARPRRVRSHGVADLSGQRLVVGVR